MSTSEHLKYLGDGLSLTVAIGTLVQILPALAALMTVIWTAIRIYETETVQRLVGRRKDPAAGAGDGKR